MSSLLPRINRHLIRPIATRQNRRLEIGQNQLKAAEVTTKRSIATIAPRWFPNMLAGRQQTALALPTLSLALYPLRDFAEKSVLESAYSFPTAGQVRHRSNRSKRGLYDGKDIRAGNNVSFSMKKTKRKFKPNVQKKRLYSEILDEMVNFHVTTSALRTIDKYGGVDNYLMKSEHIVAGKNEGWKTKERILQRVSRNEWLKKNPEAEEKFKKLDNAAS